jgi:hypothetical protein
LQSPLCDGLWCWLHDGANVCRGRGSDNARCQAGRGWHCRAGTLGPAPHAWAAGCAAVRTASSRWGARGAGSALAAEATGRGGPWRCPDRRRRLTAAAHSRCPNAQPHRCCLRAACVLGTGAAARGGAAVRRQRAAATRGATRPGRNPPAAQQGLQAAASMMHHLLAELSRRQARPRLRKACLQAAVRQCRAHTAELGGQAARAALLKGCSADSAGVLQEVPVACEGPRWEVPPGSAV